MLDPSSIWHQPFDAIDIGVEQAFTFRVRLPHHPVSGINCDVVDGVNSSLI